MSKKVQRKKGGARKIGRDSAKCQSYRVSGRREENKARRKAKEAKRQKRLQKRRIKNEKSIVCDCRDDIAPDSYKTSTVGRK